MSSMRLAIFLCSACFIGCSAILDYPESDSETGALHCANALDDDFDGESDCDDPDCDGQCVESGARCADGRNNDGDDVGGSLLVDGLDPSCWALTGAHVERRCAYRHGTALELRRWSPYEAFSSPDWVTTGAIDEGDDGPGWLDSILLLPGQFIETRAAMPGAIGSMGLELIFSVPEQAELVVSYVSDRFGVIASVRYVRRAGQADAEMWIVDAAGRESPHAAAGIPDTTDEFPTVQFFSSGTRWYARSLSTEAAAVSLERDASLPPDEPLVVRLEAVGDLGASASVQFVRAVRNSFDTCDRSFASPLHNAPSLRSIAANGRFRCAILGDRPQWSVDGSAWFGGRSAIEAGDVGLAWVETFSRFEGVRFDPASGRAHLFVSSDCDRFRESDPVALDVDAEAIRVVGFDYEAGRTPIRRIHVLSTDATGGRHLVELESTTGLPDSYLPVRTSDWPHSVWQENSPVTATRVGDDLVVIGPGADPTTAALRVIAPDGTTTVIDPFVAPTGEVGAFDRFRIDQVRLAPGRVRETGVFEVRAYHFAHLLPTDPGFASATLRSGVDWIDFLFGRVTP